MEQWTCCNGSHFIEAIGESGTCRLTEIFLRPGNVLNEFGLLRVFDSLLIISLELHSLF